MANLIDRITQAIENLEEEQAKSLVQEAIDRGIDPVEILQEGVMNGLQRVGKKFETQEYFLPELIMAGEASNACIQIITPHLPTSLGPKKGVVVIGSTKGDIHDIGMNTVARQLQMSGFEVHNLGIDVPNMTFIDKAQEVDADIIGLSAFLTTTMAAFSDILNYLRDMGLREKFKVIIGGGVTTLEYAASIGADGWAPNAIEAVKLCEDLVVNRIPKEA
ncbi:MAG: corrinoid protein [Anaerolineales bacterium]|jgi:corrinoid protein of di/trimethylamine methyltransferase